MSVGEPELKLVISKEQIAERVLAMSREISQAYQEKDVVLVGVLNGVFMFIADLVKNLTVPVRIDFIRLASYGSESESSGRIVMTKDIETDLTGKHVLIVEDIVDSGLTLQWLRKHLNTQNPVSVKCCVLINKLERREVAEHPEFVGFNVEQGFLVGYGLDYDGRYRQLPAIYHLETV